MIGSKTFIFTGIGAIFFLIFAYGRMGQTPVDTSIAWVIAIFLVLYLSRTFIVELKYKSPKFVSDPIHSTANWSTAQLVGNYYIIKLGAIDAYGLKFEGGDEGTAIIRRDAINKTGESVVTTARLTPIVLEELPPEIYRIKEHLKLTQPLYRADLRTLSDLKDSKYATIEIELKEKDTTINIMQDILAGRLEKVETYIEGAGRILDRKKGVTDFIKSIFIEDKNKRNEEQQ